MARHQTSTSAKGVSLLIRMFIASQLLIVFEISTMATAFAAKAAIVTASPLLDSASKSPLQHHPKAHSFHKHFSIRQLRATGNLRLQMVPSSSAALSVLRGGDITSSTSGALVEAMEFFQLGTGTPQLLFNSIFASLVLITVCSKLLQRFSATGDSTSSGQSIAKAKPASVVALQRKFLGVFWFLRCSDWLQGPYFYEVYASKLINGVVPASMTLVSQLFLTGFASRAIFGPAVGKAADQYGRKKATIAFTIVYALAAFSTKSNLLQVLFLGRILSGIGTSLLFSAPESWLVGEAQKKVKNEKDEEVDNTEYLGDTFGLAYAGDSIVAILAGQMAGAAALRSGPTGPFELSILVLGLGGLLTAFFWKENKGEQAGAVASEKNADVGEAANDTPTRSTREAIDICLNDPKIMLVGAVQSLFEAAMYIFVLQWPPAMESAIRHSFLSTGAAVPYGTIFSCFMACCLLGSTLFGQLSKMSIPVEKSTSGFIGVAALAMATSTWTVLQPSTDISLSLLIGTFFIFEMAVGMYFPSIGTLRSRFVPDSHRSLIMNLFGIPLNVLVVSVFLSIQKLGVGGALSVSSAALGLATICMLQLQRIVAKPN